MKTSMKLSGNLCGYTKMPYSKQFINKTLFLIGLDAEKSKINIPEDLVFSGGLFYGLWMASSNILYMKKGKETLWGLFYV